MRRWSGPGPGRPEDAGRLYADAARGGGDPASAARRVSWGCRASARFSAASVVHAPRLMHGKTSEITHDDSGVFAGLPSPFTATRYHSLCIAHENVSGRVARRSRRAKTASFKASRTARCRSGGVQFHPESILTPAGAQTRAQLPGERAAMNDFPQLLRAVLAGAHLSADDTARAIGGIMDETISPVRAAALLGGAGRQRRVGGGDRRRGARDARAQPSASSTACRWCSTSSGPAATARTRSTSRPPRRWSSPAAAFRSPSTAIAPPRASAGAPTSSKRWASQLERDPETSAELLRDGVASRSCSRSATIRRRARSVRCGASWACGRSSTCWDR